MKTIFPRLLLAAFGVLLLSLGSGCAIQHVQPWERGALTEYSMRPDRDPLRGAVMEHTYFSREASSGGKGVGGGGCGCN